jgi:hypothetical protein
MKMGRFGANDSKTHRTAGSPVAREADRNAGTSCVAANSIWLACDYSPPKNIHRKFHLNVSLMINLSLACLGKISIFASLYRPVLDTVCVPYSSVKIDPK